MINAVNIPSIDQGKEEAIFAVRLNLEKTRVLLNAMSNGQRILD